MAQSLPLNVDALILAGGLGTRLKGVLVDKPKVMAPILGRPFITYLFDQLEQAGIKRIILCTGYKSEKIEQAFGNQYHSCELVYSPETEPLGTGGALRNAFSLVKSDNCLAMNGDSYVNADLNAFMKWHFASGFAGSLLLTRVSDAGRFGTVETDTQGKITVFKEKQGIAVSGSINAGIYLFSRQLLESIPTDRAVSIERETFPEWVQKGIGGFCVETEFIDIGTPETLAATEAFFKSMDKRSATATMPAASSVSLPTSTDDTIRQHMLNSADVKKRVAEECLPAIKQAALLVAECLAKGNKVLLCGNGGSAADSQHIAAEFVSVLTQDFLRPGLPAIAMTTDSSILTASANDFGFAGIFERQVQALGKAGDVVIGISTSGNSENCLKALQYAHQNDIHTIAFVGEKGGKMADVAEVAIKVPSTVTQYIQESHIAVGHIICHLAERALYPELVKPS
jgi:phosphoheptose isomerase